MGVNVRIILPHKDGFVWGLGHHLRRNTIIIPRHTSGFGWFSNPTRLPKNSKSSLLLLRGDPGNKIWVFIAYRRESIPPLKEFSSYPLVKTIGLIKIIGLEENHRKTCE